MPVYIDSIKFQDDYTGLISGNGSDIGIDQLMGCVGDFMYVKINFNISWYILDANMTFSSSSKSITLNNCNSLSVNLSSLSQQTKNVFNNILNNNSFVSAGFKIGDTIVITGTTMGIDDGTYTIATISDNVITVNESIASDGAFSGVNCYGATNINALDFYYNMVGNTQSPTTSTTLFNSLTDPKAVQKFSGVTSPLYYGTTYTLNPNATSHAWWVKEVDGVNCVPTVTSYGITADYKQEFSIIFPFLITPLFLAEQLTILRNANDQTDTTILNTNGFSVPNYFQNQCLKFICQIDARYNIYTSTPDQTSAGVTFNSGNTTWFDTFYPTGIYLAGNYLTNVQYTLGSITYTDVSANVLTELDVKNITNVSVILNHTTGAAITSGHYVVNFMWLPTNPGEYQNYTNANQATFREVFLHDRCFTSVGAGAANGDQFGTGLQAITNVTTSAHTGGVKVNFKIDLGAFSKSTLENVDVSNRNYLIWITPQSPLSTALDNTDRTAVIADVNLATYNTDDSSLMTASTVFYTYPQTYTNSTTDFSAYIGQYGLATTQFAVKIGSIVESMINEVIVEVYDSVSGIVQDTFPLESWSNTTNDTFDGNISQINIVTSRGFSLDINNPYNIRSIVRAPQLDTTTFYALTTQYPFQIGYQYWLTLPAFDPMFVRYHTQYWPVYTQGFAGNNPTKSFWTGTLKSRIRYRQTWNILDPSTGITTQFLQYSDINAYDQGRNGGAQVDIETSDVYGNSLNGVLASDIPTTIQVTYTGNFTPPVGATIQGSITVSYNNGNTLIFDTLSTLDIIQETPNSLWNVPLLITTDPTSVTLIGTINLQNSPIPATNVIIYSNVWYTLDNNLVTDLQDPFITDAGDNIVVD